MDPQSENMVGDATPEPRGCFYQGTEWAETSQKESTA